MHIKRKKYDKINFIKHRCLKNMGEKKIEFP